MIHQVVRDTGSARWKLKRLVWKTSQAKIKSAKAPATSSA